MIMTVDKVIKANSLETIFQDRKAFVAYLTAGQCGLDETQKAAIALVEGGVDILEIGVPFSDPIADGMVIQAAMTQALSLEVNLEEVLACISAIKKTASVPIVLFTYLNPLLSPDLESNIKAAAKAGVDALLIVDLPYEESGDYFRLCDQYGLKTVSLIAPSTNAQRLKQIADHCTGFLYYVCRNGTTGVKSTLPDDYARKLAAIKSITDKPVVSGFGIGNQDLARQAIAHSDGFVVGSAFVKALDKGESVEGVTGLAKQIDPR